MSSIWSDVRWDRAATDELVRQLLATAGAVGEVVAILEGDGSITAEDWTGPHRRAFDEDRRRIGASGRVLAERLVAAAASVAARADAAEHEDGLRARLRHQATVAACQPGQGC